MSRYSGCTIFIGNLPGDVREREVEDLFFKYGRIVNIDLKTPPRPPAFAFVEFEDPRDAQDAVSGRDNYDFHGNRLRVEISHGRAREGRFGGGGFGGGGGGGGFVDRGGRGGYMGAADILERSRNKGTAFRAIVKGLPASASWQDLKDHFRKVVKPSYTNVVRDRAGAMGIVEFETADDLDRAIRKLDDTEFRNPFDRGYIRIIEDDPGRGGGGGGRTKYRSRSRSRSRGRSYSRSPSRSRSRSRSPSGSRSMSRSRSKSRSASKGPSASRSHSPRSASPGASPKENGQEPDRDDIPRETSRSRSPSS